MENKTLDVSMLVDLRKRLMAEKQRIEEQVKAVSVTLSLIMNGHKAGSANAQFDMNSLRGKTQLEAVIEIARKNNGRVNLKQAHEILRDAGLMRPTKNWYNILYNTINRSGKFEHAGPGEYKLVDAVEGIFEGMIERVASGEKPDKVIDEVVQGRRGLSRL